MPPQAHAIPPPVPITISPGMFAAYGALIAAAVLIVLYLYRGRAFVVYWIGSWLLVAGSMVLLARGYDDARLASVMLGTSQLLGVWSAGLILLSAEAFPDDPLRWTRPLKVAAATAVWFLAGPFVVPLGVLLATGPGLAAVLFGWAAFRYFRLGRRTRHAGAYVICGGMVLSCATSVATAGIVFDVAWSPAELNRLIGFNIAVSMSVALGMQLLVFEDMTEELRRTNRELAFANREVKNLAITDPLTGCHNRRFFEEIERREIQRHRRYGAPLSIVFTDVNHFKRFNDTMGHEMGDRILTTIGAFLRRQVRESDYVIRWGGDEFLLLLTCGYGEAQHKAGDLKVAFERERVAGSLPDGLGLSIGVASAPVDAESLAQTIREADTRMYQDKMADRAAPGSVQ
jgi:diguanylate cyclase (GGDEF)-like protein